MHRRDLLKTGASALVLSGLAPRVAFGQGTSNRMYFAASDLPRIRANAASSMLRPTLEAWRAEGPGSVMEAFETAIASGNIVSDFSTAIRALTRQAMVHLIEPSDARRDAVISGIEAAIDLPKWDYMVDGDEVIGLMRASLANTRLLFAREVLGDELAPDLDNRLLDAIGEKGCEPCYRTIVGMNHPETVTGWAMAGVEADIYDIDMSKWPTILGANNLRAIPTNGLGLGALALRDRDPRAGLWLDTAVDSARHVLGTFSADGSYFEGLSYVDYTFRTLFAFLEAHERVNGSIEWARQANFEGCAEFIAAMQAGLKEDGTPDIVNFSDASYATYPCVGSWIARQTGSELAQHVAEEMSRPGFFLDFLWMEPARPSSPPPARLKNARTDLDWIIARSGWEPDDAVLAFRSGMPANHEHADRNSFFYKYMGERLLNDHFGAAYDWRDPKWLLRLTEAHNAVLVNGQGHQYHNGEEGTNEGEAESHVVRFEPNGDRVWWTSDATHGYALVNPDITRVRRTVLFDKPEIIVLFDEIRATRPVEASVRFFPDNRDGKAKTQVDTLSDTFAIERPRARLRGIPFARTPRTIRAHQLDLDSELGVYPFFEVTADRNVSHEIVTVLDATRWNTETHIAQRNVRVTHDPSGWDIDVGGVRARIEMVDGGKLGPIPNVTWTP
ncbi:MAG: hypothetical protein Rubg2KO_21160 [Rubricoccaceae bacterium]